MRYASVVIAGPVDKAFDYAVPERLAGRIQPGSRVWVPFGPRRLAGYCVELKERASFPQVKEILAALDETPLLTPPLFALARRIAEGTLCTWGEALQAMIPAGVRSGTRTAKRIEAALSVDAARALSAAAERDGKAPKQAKLLRLLADQEDPVALAALGPGISAAAKALAAKGLVALRAVEAAPDALLDEAVERRPPLSLTALQRAALDALLPALDPPRHERFLLHGVTGSGKTEVYLQAIARAVESGRQAIVLVPEISLTPQTVRRFRERFDRVAVLHSHLTEGQREREWRAIRACEAQVAVGARSALFAPAPRLGLIVIDEEHETSFKQQSKPRYHAREAAFLRGEIENVPVILGSATPSLESHQAALDGRMRRLSLPERIGEAVLPKIQVLDLREEAHAQKGHHLLSRPLAYALQRAVAAGRQAILFLNRRGFATWVHCPHCGETIRCRQCAVSLIYHRARSVLRCHYCLFTQELPKECPTCTFPEVKLFGAGTERVLEEARAKVPRARVERMDADATRERGAHQRILDRFRDGKVDILVGTQMIAKGLDFPRVTVVGVVNADTALGLPDFRAAERTFQLIVQVAGRAGRGDDDGRVFVQTCLPNHYAIASASRHDYAGFAKEELAIREALRYPPFARLVRILVHGAKEDAVKAEAEAIKVWLERRQDPGREARAAAEEPPTLFPEPRNPELETRNPKPETRNAPFVEILGPSPAPLSRLEGQWRWHLLVKTSPGADLRWIMAHPKPRHGVKADLDVDPLSLL